MSQTTRCPSCGTLFKVVADQLRISDGWVRCGSCQQVFDASAHLQATAPAPLLPDMALDRLRPLRIQRRANRFCRQMFVLRQIRAKSDKREICSRHSW